MTIPMHFPVTYLSHSAYDTQKFGKEIALHLAPNTVVCLNGDLGGGKTTFVQGVSAAFTSEEKQCSVHSPTFSYLNIYEGKQIVYHFDLYRMKDAEQFLEMGFEEYFTAGGICCIEWCCRITSLLSFSHVAAHFTHISPSQREILVEQRSFA